VRLAFASLRRLLACAGGLLPLGLPAAPADFDLPAQPAAEALLVFSRQAKVEVLFSFDELRTVQSTAVLGRFEPGDALVHLLKDTGYTASRNGRGKFVITTVQRPTGALRGHLLTPEGGPARLVRVAIPDTRQTAMTDDNGMFSFPMVPPGIYRLVATSVGYRPLEITGVTVEPKRTQTLETCVLHPTDELVRLEPFVVRGEAVPWRANRDLPAAPPRAAGNIDLPRSENGALPFTIYTRDQIARSGVVDLNEFLQRELLDSDAVNRPPEQSVSPESFNSYIAGSSNLNLRGFGAEATVVLVNGRRLPEIITVGVNKALPPDVNFIPLSLVQRIEVLPVSASALYSGNAVGGVINIVLRSGAEANATEVTTTYTNAWDRFDAPQASVSFQHGQSLLDGRLRLRLSATVTRVEPPVESELGYRQARVLQTTGADDILFRATPNLRSSDGTPLFGAGSSPVTSVAPGADGNGGLGAFAGRQGRRSLTLFDSPGGLATSPDSLDQPYGRRQQRAAYFGSVSYDLFPTLELGLDGTYSGTVVNRGYNVFAADLALAAASPLNPFHQDLNVSLNEIAPRLGQDYSEARIEYTSAVLGLLAKLPSDWRVSADVQYAHNVTRFRGLAPVDTNRWQELVDQGLYNPLRDTQAFGPPAAFYDRALVYLGGRDRFVTLGDYRTLDAAVRVGNQLLALPTGRATLNLGADYRRNQLAGYTESQVYADGTLARPQAVWNGRVLQRYSFFGELQAPVLPARRLPAWLKGVDADVGVRYVAADTSQEANVAPAGGLKLDFGRGWAMRLSYTQANRFPTPIMSKLAAAPGPGDGVPGEILLLKDPARNERYNMQELEEVSPNLRTEASATTTLGVIFQRGKTHRLRAALDFVDTQKANELVPLEAQDALNFEALFPGRVTRAPLAPGDSHAVGRVLTVLKGEVNAASRHSQNWNLALDYAWTGLFGGTFEAYVRGVWFQRYDRRALPDSPMVDELRRPDGFAREVMKYRANFGAGWSNRDFGLGVDGHYFHSRLLPAFERADQGDKQIRPYWQFDAYLQSDLDRFLPWKTSRFGLRAQLRVNNVSGFGYPKYVNDSSGAGVQPYGDWRGRTFSVSLTATF
jgi:iron complex outermembrane receptor protein